MSAIRVNPLHFYRGANPMQVPTVREMTGARRDSARYVRQAEAERRVRKAARVPVQTNATWHAVDRHSEQIERIDALLTRHHTPMGRRLVGYLTEEAELIDRNGRSRWPRPELEQRLERVRNNIYNLLRQCGEERPVVREEVSA